MKTILLFSAMALFLAAPVDAHCFNQCCNQSSVVVTPFAIPYALPVASVSPVEYVSLGSYAPPAVASAPAATTTTTVNIDVAHSIAQEVIAGITPSIQKGIDANHAELMQTLSALTGRPLPQTAPPSQPVPPVAPPATPPATPPAQPPSAPLKAAAAGPLLFQSSCLQCHSAPAAGKRPHFESIGALSCDQKLSCIRAVLDGRMPKGHPFKNPDDAGKIIAELSAQ